MNKSEIIEQLKLENPILTYGINDETFEMSEQQYEETIDAWADARIAKAEAKTEEETLRNIKIAAYQKLGLSEAEIEVLVPAPKPHWNNL